MEHFLGVAKEKGVSDNEIGVVQSIVIDSGTLLNNLIDKRIVYGSYSLASFGFSVERGESIVWNGGRS